MTATLDTILAEVWTRHRPGTHLYGTVASVFAGFVGEIDPNDLDAMARTGFRALHDRTLPVLPEGVDLLSRHASQAMAEGRFGTEYDPAMFSQEDRVRLAIVGVWTIAASKPREAPS